MDEKSWEWIPNEQQAGLLRKINALFSHEMFTPDQTALKTQPLEWFCDWQLLQARDYNYHPYLQMLFFWNEPDLIRMDGSQEPILQLCKLCPPYLNRENVYDYARFYLGAIQAEEGTLRLVRPGWDIDFNRDPTPGEIRNLRKAIKEPEITEMDANWHIRGTVLYGDCVYRAELQVLPGGSIDLMGEELLLEDMPVREIFLL